MMELLIICLLAAICAPLLHRACPKYTGTLLAAAPLATFVWLLKQLPDVMHGHPVVQQIPWVEALGLELAFRLDGLSMLFGLLISGIGTLILCYTQGYFKGDPRQGRFLMFITAFMTSMLGVVWADHLVILFIFWELTSFTSFLLIGFEHEKEEARTAALQAMLVTVLGGLFLLAGLVLLAQATGSWRISTILEQGDLLGSHIYFMPCLIFICIGAFTKSAQFPFHFWLPNAMQAPTPASAYLHSSTMVKAGVYLLARLHPAMSGREEWALVLTVVGTLTFLTGAILALGQQQLKKLLAYTTISALGAMVMLLGVGTSYAIKAMALFILAHALYKATLFMVAGGIIHETHESSVDRLGGLRRAMPITFIFALLAGLSMGGVPPLVGFVAKEVWLHAIIKTPWLVAATVAGGAAYVLVGLSVGLKPFIGSRPCALGHVHEVPWSMRLGPILLGSASVVAAFFCGAVGHAVVEPAASAIAAKSMKVHLHLWAGFNVELLISICTVLLGIGLFIARPKLLGLAQRGSALVRFGPSAAYHAIFNGVLKFAAWQMRTLQTGLLRHYIRITVVSVTALVVAAFWRAGGFQGLENLTPMSVRIGVIAVLMVAAAIATIHSQSRMQSILSLGVVGYGMAMLFTFFGAPDLAMTQLVIETLTVILMALAFYHLPRFSHSSNIRTRWIDAVIALAAGVVVTLLVLAAVDIETPTAVSDRYLEMSYAEAHGRNVVNVILVDFRALDTLGEITVLTIAALGAFALLKFTNGKKEERS